MEPEKQKEWFDKKYAPGFFYGGKHKKELKELFLKKPQLSEFTRAKILDIGFGTTAELYLLAEYIQADYVVGLDVFKKKMKAAAQEFKDFGTYRVLNGDINNLDFEEGYFDIVACFNAFYFSEDTEAVLTKMREILKKKGYLVISLDVFSGTVTAREEQYQSNGVFYQKLDPEIIVQQIDKLKLKDITHYTSCLGNHIITAYNK